MNKKQRVYVIWNADTNRTKVGISLDVSKRMLDLQNASGCKLTLIYKSDPVSNAAKYEQDIHLKFEAFRHIGEWFNHTYEDIAKYAKQLTPNVSLTPDAVVKLRNEGHTMVYIATLFGVSRRYVYDQLSKTTQPILVKPTNTTPTGKGVRVSKNILKYDNCFIYKSWKDSSWLELSFLSLEDAIAYRTYA